MKRFFLAFLFIASLSSICAQERSIDSPARVKANVKDDTNNINILNNLAVKLRSNGRYDSALTYLENAQILATKLGYKKGIANSLTNIGVINSERGNYPKALEYDLKALAINEEAGNLAGSATNLRCIGDVYYKQGNYPSTLEYYSKAVEIEKKIDNNRDIAVILGNEGKVFFSQKKFDKALEIENEALILSRQFGDKNNIARFLGTIGEVYFLQGDDSLALDYNFKALSTAREVSDENDIVRNLGNIGDIYTHMKNYDHAKKYIDSSLYLSKQLGIREYTRDEYSYLVTYDRALGNYKDEIEDITMFYRYKDSLLNEATYQAEMDYAYDQKLAAINAEQEKKSILAKADSARRNFVIIVAILLLIMLFTSLIQLIRQKQKDKLIFEQKHIAAEKERELLNLEKRKMEEELLNARKVLDNYVNSLLEKNEIIQKYDAELDELRNTRSNELNKEKMDNMMTLRKSVILTDDDWFRFREMFENVYKGFFSNLKERIPNLTTAETRLICLTKLGVNNKQMADILGISVSTIWQTRYRLMKKLNLPEESNLNDILESI